MVLLDADMYEGLDFPGFAPLLTKIRPPRPPLDLVDRTGMLDALQGAGTRLIVLSAAAGSGKTVALVQLADRTPLPAAWLTLDPADNDPAVLLTYLHLALRPLAGMDQDVTRWLHQPAPPVQERIVPALCEAVAGAPAFLLILDDTHVLTNRHCWQILECLALALTPGSRLVLSGRTDPVLPLARWLASGHIMEFGPEDLTFDTAQTQDLLRLHGIEATEAEAAVLRETTDGWAAGLYLAILSGKGRPVAEWPARLRRHPDIARYLTSEVLEQQPADVHDFLICTSILDRLSAGSCRAVTLRHDADAILARLARENLFVAALDDERRWFRYHHLFAELLRTELERRYGDRQIALHRRAARWCEGQGLLDEAIRHLLAAGDADAAGLIVSQAQMSHFAFGRVETVRRWLERFSDEQILNGGSLLLTAGWIGSMVGADERDRLWSTAACAATFGDDPSPDGARSLRSSQAALRVGMSLHGVAQMQADAELAWRLEQGGSPVWLAGNATLYGAASWIAGDPAKARPLLEEGRELGAACNPVAEIGALTYLAHLLADEGDWEEAERFTALIAERKAEFAFAQSAVIGGSLAQARVLAHHCDPRTRAEVDAVAEALRQLSPPRWIWLSTAVLLAELYLELGEVVEAESRRRAVLSRMHGWEDAGILPGRLERLREGIRTMGLMVPLTAAERRVLALLPTRLTQNDIAGRLRLSPNTVKTHLRSIYRKLEVPTRAEAVRRAREIGILDD